MVEAIIQGERNPAALLALCDPQVKKNASSAKCVGKFTRLGELS
jgi:hypothetical protein